MSGMKPAVTVLLPLIAVLLLAPSTLWAQAGGVEDITVEGVNTNGIVFIWTVTNHSEKWINYFEVPTWDINVFEAPEGWDIVSKPRLRPGDFIARTDSGLAMIRPGQSAEFVVKRPGRSEPPAEGQVNVVIGFEDGRRVVIPNVSAFIRPRKQWLFAVPVGLALLLIIYAWAREAKKRKSKGAADAGSPSPGAGGISA